MRKCEALIEGMSTYSQSQRFSSERAPKESAGAFEQRAWKEKAHLNSDGQVFIPGMSLKYSVDEAIKRLAIQIPGEGKTRFTKYFEAGCALFSSPLLLNPDKSNAVWTREDLVSESRHCDPQGRKSKDGGNSVLRLFPVFSPWATIAEFFILDDKITEEVFETALRSAGLFVGIGRWRPQNAGMNGRFHATKMSWSIVND